MPKFIACLLLSLALLGCEDQTQEVLRFGLSSAPINLDPRFATDAASSRINRLIYQRLVDFDDSYRPVAALAQWQQLSPKHYRFSLMQQAEFHDGRRLTAADVKATYASILDPKTASPHRAGFTVIDRIEVVDDKTVDFILNKADPLFPGRLVIGILPAQEIAAGHRFSRQPLGSGPYEFLAWPEEGRLRLSRRADGQPLEFVEIKNPTVRVLKLLRGEIDMVQNDLPTELVIYLQAQDEVRVVKGRGSNFTYLGFNLQDESTADLKLRQAIAYAIDREAIIHYVMGDAAMPASALLPPDHWAGNPDLVPYVYDPERARQLVEAAGYDEHHRPRLTYKTSSDPFRIRLATVIQQQLGEVGIDVDLRSYDWGTFYGDIKAGRFQMFSLSWVGIKTPDIFRYVFHRDAVPPNGANRGRFFDEISDNLIEQAEAAPQLADQAYYYRKLQARLLAQLPYVPLWYEDHVFVARKEIAGYQLARDGNYDGLVKVIREAAP